MSVDSVEAAEHDDPRQVLLASAERFARETVSPGAVEWERRRTISRAALSEAASLGFMGVEVPARLGGLGLPFSAKSQLCEVLASADFGFAMSVVNSLNVATKLANHTNPALAERYLSDLLSAERLGCTALTEPGAGSDFGAIRTTATRTADGWRISGEKAWIVNASQADVVVLYAQTEPGTGGAGIAAFIIDGRREGFHRNPPFDLAGQHTIGTGGFVLENYEASDDELFTEPGQGFKDALRLINGARTYVAAMCCGMMAEALSIARHYGTERQTFGQPLAGHQGWRWPLAEVKVELDAARLMVARAAERLDAGQDTQVEAATAKLFATRAAERHLPRLLHAMGAEGLRERYPFGRHIIGARVAQFVDGSNEMLLERVAAHLR